MVKKPELTQEQRRAQGLTVEADIEGLGEVRCEARDLFDRSLLKAEARIRVSFGLRVVLDCSSCKGPIPLNQIAQEAFCPQCKGSLPLGEGFWTTALDTECMASAFCASSGVGYSTSCLGSDFGAFELWCRRNPPYCHGCKSQLPPELVDAAVAGGSITCPRCESAVPIRPAGELEQAICPGALAVISETGRGVGAPPATAQIRCQECGADLEVDGAARTVACGFCEASNLIPDAVWDRLHPAPIARELYLVADVADEQRWLWLLSDEERRDKIDLGKATLSAAALARLAESEEGDLREIAAAKEGTPPAVLERLARDDHGQIQALVAGNPQTPLNALRTLAARAPRYIAANPRIGALSDEALLELMERGGSDVHAAIATNPGFPVARIAKRALEGGRRSRETLARRAGELPSAVVARLSRDQDRDVLKALAENLAIGEEVLARLAKSPDKAVRLAVARNPNTANRTLRRLACDRDEEVRAAAAEHPNGSRPSLWDRLRA
jgi:hypothetical protein